MWNSFLQSPPAWILTRRLSSFQRFFELGSEESSSPFLDNRAKKISRNLALKNALAATAFLAIAFICSLIGSLPLSNISLCFVYLLVGTPSLIAAVQDIVVQKDVNIDVLTTLAAFGALFLGSSLEGALLLVLFSLSGSLEDLVTLKAKRALCALHEIRPNVAYIASSDGSVSERAVEDVQVGEVVVVRPGEVVPLDGIVLNSGASVDLSHLTGESQPLHVKEKETVASGSKVLNGYLEVQVTCTSTDSTIGKLIRMITKAHTSKPKLSIAFERYGRLYASGVIVISCVLAFFLPLLQEIPFLGTGGGLFRAISFLITASPCALIIAIPITYLSALGASVRKGAILKGWTVFDHLRSCAKVAFDKTGTLTTGKLRFDTVIPVSSGDEALVPRAIGAAASLEKYSVHPVADALIALCNERQYRVLEVASIDVVPGSGVHGNIIDDGGQIKAFVGGLEAACAILDVKNAERCRAICEIEKSKGRIICILVLFPKNSVHQEALKPLAFSDRNPNIGPFPIVESQELSSGPSEANAQETALAFDNGHSFVFSFEDVIRESSRMVVQDLRNNGKNVVMLTGDNLQSAQKIAAAVDIQEVYARLLPEDKLALVEKLSASHGLMMVGDGINDAPALARSTVGVSMGQVSSASARESSDIVLLNNELPLLPWLFAKADVTWSIVRQNLIIAIMAILVGTIGSVEGYIPLWVAVCIHEGSTLVVGLNALRLLLV